MEIDLTRYAGCSEGEWEITHGGTIFANGRLVADVHCGMRTDQATTDANRALLTDAPKLLAEVVRLRADLAEAVQTLEAIEIAARMRFSPADILDENSPIREGMRAVLAKHGGGK